MFLYLVTIIFVLSYSIFRYRRRRLYQLASSIAGPKEHPLIGHLKYFAGNTEDVMTTIKEFSYFAMKNNGFAKIWFGPELYFLVVDPADLEVILKTSLEKDALQRFVRDFLGCAMGFAPVSIWRPRRKIMVPTFSPKILENFVEIFSRQSHKLAELLEKRIKPVKFSIWPTISTYTLDSVCETVMGIQLNSQENHETRLLKLLSQGMHLICTRMSHIWLQPNWLFRIFPMYKEYNVCIKQVHEFADEIVCRKRVEIENSDKGKINGMNEENDNYGDISSYAKQTFLELLINKSGGAKGYNNIELREETLALIIAGTDTSAASIGYTLKLMAMYPDIQEKVYTELFNVFGDSDRPLVKEDLSKLSYLECVVKESLRLFPPVPLIIRKVTTETSLPSGRILPAGCNIMASIWGVHRDPKYWGDDVDSFDPTRFMPERLNLGNTCSYMPFSSGPRNCVGYQYALMSVKTALSAILRKYRVKSEPASDSVPRIRVKIEIMMKAVDDYQVSLEKRK